MKKFVLAICAICFVVGVTAQTEKSVSYQIELDAMHSNSSTNHYYSNFGAELHLNRLVNQHSFGVGFGEVYNGGRFYDWYLDCATGTPIRQRTSCWNKWFTINLNYTYKVYSADHSSILFGPFVGLNYLIINESGRKNDVHYDYDKTFNNRFGLGIALEYEVRFNAFSTSLKVAPNFVYISTPMDGIHHDVISIMFNMNRSISIKYTLGK